MAVSDVERKVAGKGMFQAESQRGDYTVCSGDSVSFQVTYY